MPGETDRFLIICADDEVLRVAAALPDPPFEGFADSAAAGFDPAMMTAGGGHRWELLDDEPWRRIYVELAD